MYISSNLNSFMILLKGILYFDCIVIIPFAYFDFIISYIRNNVNIPKEKSGLLFARKIRFPLIYLLCASAFEPKHAVRDERRKNQPKRCKSDNRIGDDRAHRSRTCKHLRNEIEIEKPEKPPVDRTDDYQDIRDNVNHSHNLPSCKQYVSIFESYAIFLCAFYSVRKAITGSFFAAAEAGIKPLISVNTMLTATIISAEESGSAASVEMPVSTPRIALTPVCSA